jgi:hypothetical protein
MGFSTYPINLPWALLKFDVGESLIFIYFSPLLSKASNHQIGMGRQYPERILFAAECKRMGKTSKGRISGGEILK